MFPSSDAPCMMDDMNDQPLSVTITPQTVFYGVLILIGFALAYYLRDLILIVVTAIVLASAIEPLAQKLVRWGLGRILAVVLIYLATAGLLSVLFYFFMPPLLREANALLAMAPKYLATFGLDTATVGASTQSLPAYAQDILKLQGLLTASSAGLLAVAGTIFGGLISFSLIAVLSFYFAVQDQGVDDFLRLVSPIRHQRYVLNLWRRSQRKMGRWFQGQLVLSFIVGALIYFGLLVLSIWFDVRYPFILAVVAALFELIPVFGSILAAIPAVALSFFGGGVPLALWVIALYFFVNQVQGNIIYPMVVQKVLGVPPLVVILAIIVGAQLGGFLGILVAVPVAAALQEYVTDIMKKKERTLAEFRGEEQV